MEANDTCKGRLRVEAPPAGAAVARRHDRLRPARRGNSRPRAQPLAARRSQEAAAHGQPYRQQGWLPLSRVVAN
ncbi:hypothetical protein BHM03_00050588, partial [Ensete ventricosum]